MKKFQEKKKVYIMIAVAVALIIGVAYAFLTTNLNIIGNTTVKRNTWDVHFENFAPTPGSVTATSAGIDGNETTVNYTVTLQKPGDFYEFSVDAVNEGSIDAMISTVTNTGLTSAQAKYAAYSVTYDDGTPIEAKQKLEAETGKATIKVRVEYKKDITVSDLPETDQVLNLTFSVTYVQADSTAVVINVPKCKRATTLHTDGTNTYGSLGTKGTLAAGDAFDCDVNGDGTFDGTTERFYYVSDLDTDSSYAVLVYSNNVSGATIDNNSTYSYNANASSGDSVLYGPLTAKTQLPTTSQWSNVSLASTTRNIKDVTGTVRVANFSYEGYAARLLTYQEVVSACGTGTTDSYGYLNNCLYLRENIVPPETPLLSDGKYKYYLETYKDSPWGYDVFVTQINAVDDSVGYSNAIDSQDYCGVRPAIEVRKSRITY